MARGVVESWSLEPIGRVQIGPDEYPVPPLTFGRFQRLLSLDAAGLMRGMAGGDAVAAWPWIEVCLPGVTRNRWEAFCTEKLVADLFVMFGKAHDWAFVSDAIRFGEPVAADEPQVGLVEITAAMLAMAQKSGHKVQDLFELRLEAFYLIVESLRQGAAQAEEPATLPPGIAVEDGDATGLLEKLRAAEGATDGD